MIARGTAVASSIWLACVDNLKSGHRNPLAPSSAIRSPSAVGTLRRVSPIPAGCTARSVPLPAPQGAFYGWLNRPRVDWEPTAQWPGHSGDDGGPFRSRKGPTLVAHRERKGWLGERLKMVEAALSEEHLYVRKANDEIERIPLEHPRGARGYVDRTYRFGRCTQLRLPYAVSCPVAQALDDRLSTAVGRH